MFRTLLTTLFLGLISARAAELKVAVLHPLLGDIARSVGGDQVKVIDLIGPNGDPHHFEPKPEDLKQAEGAALYLVAGMGLEGYLPKLKAIIANKAMLIEVGTTLPALEGACDEDEHQTAHEHELDPHWWHSIDLFRRATAVVADALATASPENSELFQKNATAYRNQLDELERWTKREISKIPRDKRQLATAHAAFNYFCKDFGFTAHPVQGLNREQMPDPGELAALIAVLKKDRVVAIFPEKESNPKILQTLTHDTGIRLAEPLIADGVGVKSYQEMFRHNVEVIVKALAPPEH
ncbi:MAG: metal ABC transporter substrate-binding protein [Luteolibacter sp.]